MSPTTDSSALQFQYSWIKDIYQSHIILFFCASPHNAVHWCVHSVQVLLDHAKWQTKESISAKGTVECVVLNLHPPTSAAKTLKMCLAC